MCRYAEYGPYKDHFACFSCRKMFRRPAKWELARLSTAETVAAPCPQCGHPMVDMGKDFKAPKQADAKQWKKVHLLYLHGYTYHSCGCGGPRPRPANLKEVRPFVAEQRRLAAEDRRLRRLTAAEERRRLRRRRSAKARQEKRYAKAVLKKDREEALAVQPLAPFVSHP